MCIIIPGKVVEIKGDTAVIDFLGEKQEANASLIADLKVGEYVIARAGFVLEKIPEKQALQSLSAWKDAGTENE